jgi:cell wall assembly regulator SMI1
MGNLYNNKFINMKDRITIREIQELESKYHFSFPAAIREHYLTYNGGEPEKYVFVDNDGDEYIIQQFIPINSGNRDLYSVLNTLRLTEALPEWLIPFADEPSGDLFCFSTKEDRNGEIYLWFHEVIGKPEESYSYLCKSISEFINRMQEDI